MAAFSRQFQIFAKPIGPICNLDCQYCYYLRKKSLFPQTQSFYMPEDILEKYIIRHIEASPDKEIHFCWHGGEPTILGLDYFRSIINIQNKHKPPDKRIVNGMQTNGTLLDGNWCRFLADENFSVGLSLDGPEDIHNKYRLTKDKRPAFKETMAGFEILKKFNVNCEILCVVNSYNVQYPLKVYNFFRRLGAPYISFLSMVEPQPNEKGGVSPLTVPSESWGVFLCTVFDEWVAHDIGKIKVQIFEEAARTAFNQEHTLCIFKKICGDCPVIEHNGDFYSCDHFVDKQHRLGNITENSLTELLDNPAQRSFGESKLKNLPRYCLQCEVRQMCNGGCLKNRFIDTPDGEPGLNYLCAGYKRFFNHCKPFVTQVAAEWHSQEIQQQSSSVNIFPSLTAPKIGRNTPCPCGSGKKFKNCCMPK